MSVINFVYNTLTDLSVIDVDLVLRRREHCQSDCSKSADSPVKNLSGPYRARCRMSLVLAMMARVRFYPSFSWLRTTNCGILELLPAGDGSSDQLAAVAFYLAASDVQSNAELALKNLVNTADKLATRSEGVAQRIEDLTRAGQDAIQSKFIQNFQSTVPQVDDVVRVLDNIFDVSTSIATNKSPLSQMP